MSERPTLELPYGSSNVVSRVLEPPEDLDIRISLDTWTKGWLGLEGSPVGALSDLIVAMPI